MDILTLYAAQGDLAAVRAGDEAIIIDAHMPTCDEVTPEQIEDTLAAYLAARRVRGLILTGLDSDHACPAGVESILRKYQPDWVMYPKCYKDTGTASEVFAIISREVARRASTSRPLVRQSVCLDRVESRFVTTLATNFSLELFSPHTDDMGSSNNSSIVVKLSGLDSSGFSYLVTGDTEAGRWERINAIFGAALNADVLSAPHHGSRNGVHVPSLLHIRPNTVLISAGVDSCYGHPDPAAVSVYQRLSKHVFSTSVETGICLFTRRSQDDFETHLVRHASPSMAAR